MLAHILAVGQPTELIQLVVSGSLLLAATILVRWIRQPYLIAYILCGVLLGQDGFGLIQDNAQVEKLGEFGLILLLFFIGSEVSIPDLAKGWRTTVFGTLFQIAVSVLFVWFIGMWLDWSMNRILVLGFVTSLSSSAVIIKLLEDRDELDSLVGRRVLGILLMQDVLIVPMLILIGRLTGQQSGSEVLVLQLIGGVLLIALMILLLRKKVIPLPFDSWMESDKEAQVLYAAVICFGFAAITAFFQLSAALGAFVGGMLVHATTSTKWIQESLHSFRVLFVAVFFMSVGLMIDLDFLRENLAIVLSTVLAVLVVNHLINSLILRVLGSNWRESAYGGAMLAQVGELGFVLVGVALAGGIITDFSYQLTMLIISISLLISPFWIEAFRRFTRV